MKYPLLNNAEATSHSAISVVNAIPAGRGVTIGIDVPCRVSISLLRGANSRIKIKSDTKDPHHLIETCVEYTMNTLGVELPNAPNLVIDIKSKIPTAVGLKSSSAVSVAVVEALQKLYSSKLDVWSILRTSCIASKDSKASLTGAYDDASASLLGGLVFADNTRFKILKHMRIPKSLGTYVAVLVPIHRKKLTSNINRVLLSQFKGESAKAFDFALDGEITQAMWLNSVVLCASLGYSIRPVTSALCDGATAAGVTGKGPAVAAICESSKISRRVTKRWYEENPSCKVVAARIVQPEKLVRLGAKYGQ